MRLDPSREIWISAPDSRAVMDALLKDGGQARFVGGAVRNSLMQRPVTDIDIATPLLPEEVTRRLRDAGLGAAPTGIEHGTVTAIAGGKPFEITTLRRDVSTDVRRATVAFTRDWKEDAGRRDFTINALYAAPDGEVFDYFGGLADLEAATVRFVGDPIARIREDYLRILRLFRFHAWYGRGDLDADALRAAAAEKSGIAQLSGERIQKELLKLLEAENPVPVLRAMAVAGILAEILPGPLALGRLEKLIGLDRSYFFAADPLLRLAGLAKNGKPSAEELARRLKLSNADRQRLIDLGGASEKLVPYLSIREARRLLYRLGSHRFNDRVRLTWAEDAKPSNAIQWRALLAISDAWRRPVFPLTGRDVMSAGVPEGPLVGRILSDLEEWWIESDFTEDKFSLAERLKAVAQALAC